MGYTRLLAAGGADTCSRFDSMVAGEFRLELWCMVNPVIFVLTLAYITIRALTFYFIQRIFAESLLYTHVQLDNVVYTYLVVVRFFLFIFHVMGNLHPPWLRTYSSNGKSEPETHHSIYPLHAHTPAITRNSVPGRGNRGTRAKPPGNHSQIMRAMCCLLHAAAVPASAVSTPYLTLPCLPYDRACIARQATALTLTQTVPSAPNDSATRASAPSPRASSTSERSRAGAPPPSAPPEPSPPAPPPPSSSGCSDAFEALEIS